eukprot:scaffold61530_cov51-Attheya_sp.AAC.6
MIARASQHTTAMTVSCEVDGSKTGSYRREMDAPMIECSAIATDDAKTIESSRRQARRRGR